MARDWKAEDYESHGRFVSRLGQGVVDLLNPKPGERILDLGCGDGALTQALAEAGAEVVGFDASPDFVAAARARGLEAVLGDAHSLPFDAEFDAVFSNAALHWMTQPRLVAQGAARALRPGGRFAAEMGGHGNIASIRAAIRAVLLARTGREVEEPKYFPTPEHHAALLAEAGFEVKSMTHFARPTPLPTDMIGWLTTFASWMEPFCEGDVEGVRQDVSRILAPILRDEQGVWRADYFRLRFLAVKPE